MFVYPSHRTEAKEYAILEEKSPNSYWNVRSLVLAVKKLFERVKCMYRKKRVLH